MTDTQLTIAAMLFELGVPVILAAVLLVAPKLRPFCYSVLGALIPLLFAYLSVVTSTSNSVDSGDRWAAEAIWVMSFFAYVLALLVGIVLGLIAWPKHSTLRFLISSIVSIGVIWIALLVA